MSTLPSPEIETQQILRRRLDAAKATNDQLVDALEALLDWGREHTSPTDPNSPHALLVDTAAVLAELKGDPQ